MYEIKNLTWEDKVSLCEQWQSSGLSITKFCEQQNIARTTFNKWCIKLWPSKYKTKKLCPVKITNPEAVTKQHKDTITIEILLPNTITARLTTPTNQVRFLLQELLHATTAIW